MQMLMFKDSFLPISNALYNFYLFVPDLDEVQNLLPPSFAWNQMEMCHYYSSAEAAGETQNSNAAIDKSIMQSE